VKGAEGLSCPSASLILAGEDEGQAFLVCDNFSALMRWNKSTWFALVIGLLSDRIAEAGGPDQAGAVSPVE
ncbi:MAG TPA: lytic murein transglycosylase, partial [Desulfuromonadales bacterium]|nr:lytic murein transglycosylase [Desulfuromonadales bacterium]